MSKERRNLEKDLCRCCHTKGSFKSLFTPYFYLDVEEIYLNLLRECLDIELEVTEQSQGCTICDVCIQKLQDAAQFKRQVQECETRFRNSYTNVPVPKRLKHRGEKMVSSKRKISHLKKHTVLLKNDVIELGYESKNFEEIVYSNHKMKKIGCSNHNMTEIGCSNQNITEIGCSNQDMTEIDCSNQDMTEIDCSDQDITEIDYSNQNAKEICHSNKSVEEIGNSDNLLNNNCNMNKECNVESDSDIPISQLSKEYADEEDTFLAGNSKSDSDNLNGLLSVIHKAPQYRVYGAKPLSERKRIRVTCETVLKYTTACPFRHHKSWFRCFYCTQDFMDIDKLRQHTLQIHNTENMASIKRYPRTLQIDISDFQCKICSEVLTNITCMVEHLSEVHEKIAYKECIADYKVNTSPYTCHLCRKQYHVFRTLTTHLNEHYANFICDVCGKPFLNTKRLKVHKRTHESGQFPCSQCGKVLNTKTAKANHMEGHSKRILKCSLCSEPMKNYNDRIKHMSKEHNITHMFKCVICGREYNIKHYLATHMRQTHGHKNKKCLDCGMAFITNHGLKKHMLKHTGEKAFSCSICSKAYARSYSLKEHMRGHENEKVGQ